MADKIEEVDSMLATHPINFVIALALLAWADGIGMDPPMPPPPPPLPAASTGGAAGRAVRPATKGYEQPKLEPAFSARLDKRLFLASFKRQAEAELMGCLRSWHTSVGSLLVAADLTKEGRLTNILFLGAKPPPCAAKAIAAMNFSALTTKQTGSSLVVQWRIDW